MLTMCSVNYSFKFCWIHIFEKVFGTMIYLVNIQSGLHFSAAFVKELVDTVMPSVFL